MIICSIHRMAEISRLLKNTMTNIAGITAWKLGMTYFYMLTLHMKNMKNNYPLYQKLLENGEMELM